MRNLFGKYLLAATFALVGCSASPDICSSQNSPNQKDTATIEMPHNVHQENILAEPLEQTDVEIPVPIVEESIDLEYLEKQEEAETTPKNRAIFNLRFKNKNPELNPEFFGEYIYCRVVENGDEKKYSFFNNGGTCLGAGIVGEGLLEIYTTIWDWQSEMMDFLFTTTSINVDPMETGEFVVEDNIQPTIRTKESGSSSNLKLHILTEPEACVEIFVDGRYTRFCDDKTGHIEIPLVGSARSVRICVEDAAGNRTEITYEIERRGVLEGHIIYDGEIGEKIHEKFGKLIDSEIDRVKDKYQLRAVILEVIDYKQKRGIAHEGSTAAGPFIHIEGDTFLLGERETPENGLSALIHELGHISYGEKLERFDRQSLEARWKFQQDYERACKLEIVNCFRDSNFEGDGGHPEDDEGELYASAFMICNRGYLQTFRDRYYPSFTQKQQEVAESIFSFVSR